MDKLKHLKRRRLAVAFVIAAAAITLVAAMPGAAGAAGATQTVETFTNQPSGFILFEDPCTGQQVGGYTFDTGWVRTTETPNGVVQARGHTVSIVDLYVTEVPPWDPSFTGFGPLVGTWTFINDFAGPVLPDGRVVNGFVWTGQLTYPDGTTSHLLVTFRFVLPPDGPPTVFFVKAVCGG
ncbi:MAG TPA: hypothetical protein VE269_01055 [Gaiellaceae bacterium]|nr:hypothetical protein [Gaiellaceae bacterium]